MKSGCRIGDSGNACQVLWQRINREVENSISHYYGYIYVYNSTLLKIVAIGVIRW